MASCGDAPTSSVFPHDRAVYLDARTQRRRWEPFQDSLRGDVRGESVERSYRDRARGTLLVYVARSLVASSDRIFWNVRRRLSLFFSLPRFVEWVTSRRAQHARFWGLVVSVVGLLLAG